MKLESANIELHVHTLQAPPKDATLYENWKTASEDLEAKSNESIATSKAMRTNMKKTQDESDAKVKHHDSSVFAALLRRTEECVARTPLCPSMTDQMCPVTTIIFQRSGWCSQPCTVSFVDSPRIGTTLRWAKTANFSTRSSTRSQRYSGRLRSASR